MQFYFSKIIYFLEIGGLKLIFMHASELEIINGPRDRRTYLETGEIIRRVETIFPKVKKRVNLMEKIITRVLSDGSLEQKNSGPKRCCCIDDRINRGDDDLSIAGSGILIIENLISKGLEGTEIIPYMNYVFEKNNIKTLTSHEDCGAGGLFYDFLIKKFNLEDSLENTVRKLEEIFPEISNIYGEVDKLLVNGKKDLVTALVLKYMAKKCNIGFEHIELSKDNTNLPKHSSRSLIINLSNYNLNKFFKEKKINPGYKIDASICLNSDFLELLIEQIIKEAVISKNIAKKSPGLCCNNKMIVSIVIEPNEKQKILAKLIESKIYDIINNFHPELNEKFEIHLVLIAK